MVLSRTLGAFAALNGAMAVILGAFAAHGAGPAVKTLLTTGAQYQAIHALLALICAVMAVHDRRILIAGWLAATGGLVFCLALALVGAAGIRVMGAVAPVGGVLMISGWLLLSFALITKRSPASSASN